MFSCCTLLHLFLQIVLPGWEGSEGGKLDKSMLESMTLVEVSRCCVHPSPCFVYISLFHLEAA